MDGPIGQFKEKEPPYNQTVGLVMREVATSQGNKNFTHQEVAYMCLAVILTSILKSGFNMTFFCF